jgi:hypothetical protein
MAEKKKKSKTARNKKVSTRTDARLPRSMKKSDSPYKLTNASAIQHDVLLQVFAMVLFLIMNWLTYISKVIQFD